MTDTTPPKPIGEWLPMDPNRYWQDGMQLLCAVPICNRLNDRMVEHPDNNWHWEYDVVVIRCDENYFNLENNNGDTWGWELSDVEFYIILSE